MATDTTSRRIVVHGVCGNGKSVVLRALFHNPKIKGNSDFIFSEWIDLPEMGIPHLSLGNGTMMVLATTEMTALHDMERTTVVEIEPVSKEEA
ncbi:hypothetical protein V6N13_048957 [Hibiscus sabdariffa]|uniref:Uncharacterized protein n=1 Tax=Hibiscus sabdariffa TaxID=183260 RepID=A0ABR2QYP6_9ROSI